MSVPTSRVAVPREPGTWLAYVPEPAGARTDAIILPTLNRAVRE